MNHVPPRAEIIAIGSELVAGDTVDTNSAFLARHLRDIGLDVRRHTTIPDQVEDIAQAVAEALARSHVVVTTGGLGPTVDDPTRQGLAQAMGRELVFSPEAWAMVQARYAARGCPMNENARRQAYVPAGAQLLPNEVGTAPGFVVETERGLVMALPGVPREMERMFLAHGLPLLRARFPDAGVVRTRHLVVRGLVEAEVDARVADLEAQENPRLGLAARPDRVLLRLTARAATPEQAERLLDRLEADLRRRLGPWLVEDAHSA
ncbi:MAG: competence/damage-inducible protein A [Chloroflexi bacterium]|nr:competence/damage-inducible protein A [Chloroflexota bacterium]